MYEVLKGRVHYWATFNEMNHIDPTSDASDMFVYILFGFTNKDLGENKEEQRSRISMIGCNMTLAAVEAVEIGHEVDRENKIGCVFWLTPSYPACPDPNDVLLAYRTTIRDFYQIDAMCSGAFPEYKIREYQKLNIDIQMAEEDGLNGTITLSILKIVVLPSFRRRKL